jgi:predicted CXXCH cytochrome family protein
MTARTKMALLVVGALALTMMMMVPGLAFANAGIHGNYDMNTDQCAACHRAHTAPSQATWVDGLSRTRSALLLGSYTELYQFCLTCHGATATGADTNVEEGVYEARVTAGSYGDVNQPLISGPFGVPYPTADASGTYYKVGYAPDGTIKRVTSTHDYFGGSWGAYGGGIFGTTATVLYTGSSIPSVGVGDTLIKMDCGTCHDVHGSSNYRLLRDEVYGVAVGGYDSASNPTPYVESNEPLYPDGGFRLHENAIANGYVPDYTTPYYRKGTDPQKGLSGWCVGCHTFYMGDSASIATTYNAGDVFGLTERHRHPVNVRLSNFKGPRSIVVTGNPLPLAHDAHETGVSDSDWVDCITCHYAHGSTAVMTGYANVYDPTDMQPDSGRGGVAPTDDSALLRSNNRSVCQTCHNK